MSRELAILHIGPVYFMGSFELDPLLIGEEKKKQMAYNYTKTCLEIGRMAQTNCGEMIKEEANLSSKFDLYKCHILVWDLSIPQEQKRGEIQ